MGLICQGYQIATLRRHSFSGEQGLGHHARLWFGVEMDVNATPSRDPATLSSPDPAHMTIHSVGGNVTVKTRKRPAVNLGHINIDRPLWINTAPFSQKRQLAMFVDLAPGQIEALEESRNGEGGLEFTLSVAALTEHNGNIDQARESVLFSINQSDWLSVLTQIGYGDFLLFEIPAPISATADTDYIAHLRKARQHIWLGHYEEAVIACRTALACYWDAKKLASAITASERAFCGKRNGASTDGAEARNTMSKDERFLLLYRAAKHLTDAPAHPEGRPPQPFTRSQAISVLSIVASLLSVGDLGQAAG